MNTEIFLDALNSRNVTYKGDIVIRIKSKIQLHQEVEYYDFESICAFLKVAKDFNKTNLWFNQGLNLLFIFSEDENASESEISQIELITLKDVVR